MSNFPAYLSESACRVADPMFPEAPITKITGFDILRGYSVGEGSSLARSLTDAAELVCLEVSGLLL